MLDLLLPVITLILGKANGSGENTLALLTGLNSARRKRTPVTNALDVEEDWDGVGASEEEVAVARVGEEVFRDSLLSRSKALGNYCTSVDTSCAGRVPWLAGIGEDVLWRMSEGSSEMG